MIIKIPAGMRTLDYSIAGGFLCLARLGEPDSGTSASADDAAFGEISIELGLRFS